MPNEFRIKNGFFSDLLINEEHPKQIWPTGSSHHGVFPAFEGAQQPRASLRTEVEMNITHSGQWAQRAQGAIA